MQNLDQDNLDEETRAELEEFHAKVGRLLNMWKDRLPSQRDEVSWQDAGVEIFCITMSDDRGIHLRFM